MPSVITIITSVKDENFKTNVNVKLNNSVLLISLEGL